MKNLRLQWENSANGGDSSLPLVAQNDSKWVSYLSAIPTINDTEEAAYGAAILASVGAGMSDSVPAACRQLIREGSHTEPIPDNVDRYNELYQIYREMYGALKPHNDRLSAFAVRKDQA